MAELVSFSLPLLGATVAGSMTGWAGTLSIGYFRSAQDVAMFNAPLRLANFLPLALTAMAFLYLPVASRLISERRTDEMRALYRSATKWAFLATLPLLLFFLLAAHPLVTALFGAAYAPTAAVLQVLAFGQAIHTFLGPNGMTLVAYGDSRPLFTGTMLSALAATSLCLALVPHYGPLGAAWAVAAAAGISNGYVSVRLIRRYNVHPFGAAYLKPLLFVSVVGSIGGWLMLHWLGEGWWVQISLLGALTVLAVSAPVVMGTLAEEDIEFVRAIERRLFARARLALWLEGRLARHRPAVAPVSSATRPGASGGKQ